MKSALPIVLVSCRPALIEKHPLYELSHAELSKLGITYSADCAIEEHWFPAKGEGRIIRYQEDGKGTERLGKLSKSTSSKYIPPLVITTSQGAIIQEKIPLSDSNFVLIQYPTLAHDTLSGFVDLTMQRDADVDALVQTAIEEYRRHPNREFRSDAIPIRISLDCDETSSHTEGEYVIYWYEATPSFLSALPAHILERIETNRAKINRMRNTPMPQDRFQQNTTLEACVHPNSVNPRDVATVQFTLPEDSRVSVALYDILGKHVQDLSACEARPEGVWEDHLLVQDVPPGVYLLAVTTDRGEQSLEKLIVER